MGIQVGGLIGLISGIVFGLAGLYFGRKEAKKSRGLDEVNEHIWQKARSISWYVTLVVIYILLLLTLLGSSISLVKALSVLLIIHLFSWAIVGTYLTINMYDESKADKNLHQILLTFFAILGISMIVITIFFIKG